MKRLFLLFAAATLGGTAIAQKTVNDANAEVRNISGSFTSVKVGSAIELILTEGTEEKVAVSSNNTKVRDHIKTEVVNGVLKISYESNWGIKINWGKEDYMKVYVSYKKLNGVEASGASTVKFENKWTTSDAKVVLSGASNMKVEIVADKLNADLSGASEMTVSGSAKELSMEGSGASSFHGFELNTQNSDVDVSGASTAHVQTEKEIKVEASGASSVRYKGNAVIKEIKSTGASSIQKA